MCYETETEEATAVTARRPAPPPRPGRLRPRSAESCYGRVAEVQRPPTAPCPALVLDTGDEARTCVLLTPETHVASTVEDLLSEEEFLADPPMGTEVSVLFAEDPPPQTVTGEDGTQYSAQTADFLWVEDARYPEGLTLSDGTALEVWATGFQEKQYRLSDGTVLLQEFPPQTDFSNDYVGNTPLRDLSPALPDGLRRYYQDRGPLYDLTEELERARSGLLSGSGELPALPGGTAGLLVRLRPRRTLLPHHPVPHAGAEASGGDPVDRRL